MKDTFDIQAYMTKGVERVVSDALKATFKDPRESAFMVKFAAASKKATKKRRAAENAGEHICNGGRGTCQPAYQPGVVQDL